MGKVEEGDKIQEKYGEFTVVEVNDYCTTMLLTKPNAKFESDRLATMTTPTRIELATVDAIEEIKQKLKAAKVEGF